MDFGISGFQLKILVLLFFLVQLFYSFESCVFFVKCGCDNIYFIRVVRIEEFMYISFLVWRACWIFRRGSCCDLWCNFQGQLFVYLIILWVSLEFLFRVLVFTGGDFVFCSFRFFLWLQGRFVYRVFFISFARIFQISSFLCVGFSFGFRVLGVWRVSSREDFVFFFLFSAWVLSI